MWPELSEILFVLKFWSVADLCVRARGGGGGGS